MAFEPNPTRADRRRLTHVDRRGRPRMVDVTSKAVTPRRAVAEALVVVEPETLSLVIDGSGPKGDVLTVAELAGVMAAKRTAELIPLCHPLALTDVGVEITPDRAARALRIRTTVATTSQTGVEMEALTAASVAALTVYDMIKAVDRTAPRSGTCGCSKRAAANPGNGTDRRIAMTTEAPARASRRTARGVRVAVAEGLESGRARWVGPRSCSRSVTASSLGTREDTSGAASASRVEAPALR